VSAPRDHSSASTGSHALRTIAIAGLIAGTLDGTAASLFYGAAPLRIFQSVAAGLLGDRAYDGGLATGLLGLLLHFTIATTAAAVFYVASQRWPALERYAVPAGIAYGIVVYFFMRLVVLPLSAATLQPLTAAMVAKGLAIHVVCIGLPIALTVHYAGRKRTSRPGSSSSAAHT